MPDAIRNSIAAAVGRPVDLSKIQDGLTAFVEAGLREQGMSFEDFKNQLS